MILQIDMRGQIGQRIDINMTKTISNS